MNTTRIPLDYGWIEYEGNEITIASTIEDPPKVRVASPLGLSLGCFTFSRLRPDGKQVEAVIFQGKQDERTRNLPLDDPRRYAGEFTIHINDGGQDDRNYKKVLEARSDGIQLYVPLTLL